MIFIKHDTDIIYWKEAYTTATCKKPLAYDKAAYAVGLSKPNYPMPALRYETVIARDGTIYILTEQEFRQDFGN